MMQKIFTLLLMVIWGNSIIIAQTPFQSEKIITDYINGKTYIEKGYLSSEMNNNQVKHQNNYDEATLVWEAEAPYAICKSVGISDETFHSFVGWRVNDEAWSFYNETSSTPEWTFDIDGAEYLPQDITSDGSYMVGANGNTIYGFVPSSGNPDWTFAISNSTDDIFNIVLSNDGETVYFVSGDDYDYSFITSVDIATSTQNWSFSLPEGGYGVSLVLSTNGEKLIVEKYYSTIVYSNNGDVIFDITRTVGAGAVPSISDDGTIFVIGNYEGYATAYEYNETDDVYEQKWQYLFEGGSNDDWVTSIAVSGDGSTIALGSLRFLGNSEYNSQIVVLDSESNLSLWVYQTNHDLISALDISQNGSMIAAASYGPINDNDDDFWLFERNSNEAVFAFNCQGSPYDIDLANNATKCIVGGKAIHARISGSGGKLYYFNINQPVSVSGIVSDISTSNYPNPFKLKTTISYQLPLSINVSVDIYNIQGKKIRNLLNEYQQQGSHTVVWDGKNENGTDVKKGVYYYNITAGKFISSKKMIYIK